MLEDAQGSGAYASVNKRKNKSEHAARRKIAVPASEFLTEPASLPPPTSDAIPPVSVSFASANSNENTAATPRLDTEVPSSSAGAPAVSPMSPSSPALSLEQRVQRLEQAVTLLQQRSPGESRAAAPPPPTAIRLDAGKRPSDPVVPVATLVPDPAPILASSVARGGVWWLLWDTWAELRAIVRMFIDPRYRLPRSARVWPLLLLVAILTAEYWVPFASVPILGSWLVKGIDLLLAFLLFKWLGHEARRYRQTSPDLPANLRL